MKILFRASVWIWMVSMASLGLAAQGWELTLADETEPGDRIQVEGVVYQADGQTPAAGVQITVYHTDIHGHYSKDGKNESQHRIEGVLVTDEQGRYRIRSIKPGAYPGGGVPAHIHFVFANQGGRGHMQELRFSGEGAADSGNRFAEARPVAKDEANVLHVIRDFKLRP